MKAAFAVVPTDTICGGTYHKKSPLIWTAYLWNCISHDVIFAVLALMKNIIFNKTESFVGRNTSNNACQILFSKSNRETMYHWFFILKITVIKIMNNLNVCCTHIYLYPRSRYKLLAKRLKSLKNWEQVKPIPDEIW